MALIVLLLMGFGVWLFMAGMYGKTPAEIVNG